MNRLMKNLVKPIQYRDFNLIEFQNPATAGTDEELFTCTKLPFWELAKGNNFEDRFRDIANIARVNIHIYVAGTEQILAGTPNANLQTASKLNDVDIWALSQRKKVKVWIVASYGGNPANPQPTEGEVRKAFVDHYLDFWNRDGSNEYNDVGSKGNPRHVRFKHNDVRVLKKFNLREKNSTPMSFCGWNGTTFSATRSYFHPGYIKRIKLRRQLVVYNGDAATNLERPTGLFWIALWPFAQNATGDDGYHTTLPMQHAIKARTYFYSS